MAVNEAAGGGGSIKGMSGIRWDYVDDPQLLTKPPSIGFIPGKWCLSYKEPSRSW